MVHDQRRNPFRGPLYRRWFAAETMRSLAAAAGLAVSLVLVDVSGDPGFAGTVGGAVSAAGLFATAVGGRLADAVSRRGLLRAALLVSLSANLALAGLAALAVHGPGPAPWLVAALCAGALLAAAGAALADPAADGALKAIIVPAEYPRAVSAQHARGHLVSMLGAPGTGWLYGLAAPAPFLLRALCEAGFLVALRGVRANLGPGPRSGAEPEGSAPPHGPARARGYREGFAFLRSQAALRRILLCAPLVNLVFFGAMSWSMLAMRAGGQQALTIGLVQAGFAVGGLAGSVIAPALIDRVPPGRLSIAGLGCTTAALAAFFLAEGRPFAMFAAAACASLPAAAVNGGLFTHVFAATPKRLQGRVIAVFGVVGGLAAAIAPLAAGRAVAADATPLFAACVCAAGAAGVLLLAASASIRGLPRP